MGIKKTTQSEFLHKIKTYYGKYNYDISKINYINSDTKVEFICSKHGSFSKIPYQLFKNKLHICKHCKKKQINIRAVDLNTFILKSNLIHENKYSYPNSHYINNSTPLNIECPLHGNFKITPEEHISAQRGCPKCKSHRLTKKNVLKRFKEKHKDKYIYPNFTYETVYQELEIECKKHGKFKQKILSHLKGHGCYQCGKDSIKKDNRSFIERSKIIHEGKYDYTITHYKHSQEKLNIICPKHGTFSQIARDHLLGMGCWKCGVSKRNKVSSYESNIIDYIKSLSPNIKIIPSYSIDRKEIDIYLPDFKLGIEFNGNYWHSHLYKNKEYHKMKSDFFKDRGIDVFHIWEYNWINNNRIIKSMIKNKLNLTPNRIYARKCTINTLDSKTYRKFCQENHIQGFSPTKFKLGLYYRNQLVACMGLGNLRRNLGNKSKPKNYYELIRYCSLLEHNVIGGAGKLLKYFERNYSPKSIISYADNDYSTGNLYEKLNFDNQGFTNISYSYYNPKTQQVENRFKYRKSELISMGYNPNQTEFEITHLIGLYRIHNSGISKYEKHYFQ
jgi:hypothetical protein